MVTVLKKFAAGFLLLFIVAGVALPFSVAEAAVGEVCDCYCTSLAGAKKPTEDKVTSNECHESCSEIGQSVAAFACGANDHPSRTPFCFTVDQCAEVNGEWDEEYQPGECTSGYHYCYPDPTNKQKVELQVDIGSYTTSIDFGEYIGKMYTWLVGSATVIAIVMLMIAGFRYVLGAGSDQISKAKTMIRNAVVGLVLLLSTYLILFTVNPDLVSLQVPRLPMIKTVTLVDSASCDDLIEEGYKVDFSGPEECGTVGTVTEDPGGGAVPDGTVCNFSHCANDREMCIPGDEPQCMACEELAYDNGVVTPSPSLCSAFNSLPRYETDVGDHTASFKPTSGPNAGKTIEWTEQITKKLEQCFYTFDPDGGGEVPSRPACARVVVSCSEVTTCSDYESRPVFTWEGDSRKQVTLDSIDLGKNSGLPGTDSGAGKTLYDNLGEITMGSFCGGGGSLNDICAWNRTDGEKACYLGSFSFTAISDTVAALGTADYNCNTTPDTSKWYYTIFD